jgi:hypothetical protein
MLRIRRNAEIPKDGIEEPFHKTHCEAAVYTPILFCSSKVCGLILIRQPNCSCFSCELGMGPFSSSRSIS